MASCSLYVTEPSPLRRVRDETVSSGAFQGEERLRGRGEWEHLGISLVLLPVDVGVMLFPVLLTSPPSLPLYVSFFITTVALWLQGKLLWVHDAMK